ncbi:MAG TPA: SusC/RagA family TonB-linked outer membrane protein [Gemmatimonadaceae bacterium]|nr:SusC/RagA family TonB-linked outer membrane protein [Gemmatimonadaceae bacterium]
MLDQLRGRAVWITTALAVMLSPASRLGAQATVGSVHGMVRQTGTQAPLANAEVTVVGTRLGALTRNDGSYVINGVPSGSQHVRVRLFGFAPNEQTVSVVANESATADFVLSPTAVQLDQVVVTGTAGQARRREVGNAISAVTVTETPEVKTDVSSLLQGRIAGASVELSTGSTGAGASIRLRGNTSVALSNQPLIYVDGVRTRSDEYPKNVPPAGSNLRSTNYNASPLNDINPDDIERIEVLKGAAATTLYGTEAAAGVIQIFTKRGAIGAPSWSFETTQGFNRERPFGLDAVDPTDTTSGSCSARFGQRNCAKYLYMNPWLRDGIKSDYNMSVGGGVANGTRYFLSGGFDDNQGVMPLDEERKYTVRANFTFAPTPTFNVDWNSSYTGNHISNTPAGNNAAGLTLNAFRRNRNYYGSANIDTISQVLQYQLNTWINRVILGGTANYAPFAGMTNRFTIGLDRANVENRNLRPFGFPESPTGTLSDEQWANQVLTTDYVGTFEHGLFGLSSTFAWGGQASMNDTRDVQAYTIGFGGPGDPTISTGSQWNGSESRIRILTGGLFLQEMLGWRDRLFVTAGARFDKYSAFGSNLGVQTYPKISASYVISDESFWQSSFLSHLANTMKLRAAYGQAGRAPGAFDWLRSYDAVGWGGLPALRTRNLGNPDLGPERSAETEIGFESSSLNGRVGVDLTYYRTRTTDALISLTPPPSGGFLNGQLENIGTLDKKGLELAINTTPLQLDKLTWNLGTTIALNKNRVLSLGGAAPFNVSPGGNGNGFAMEGQPLAVLRGRYITNADDIADPIIEQNHLFGPSQPTRIIGLTSSLRFPKGIELSARAEYQGGNYLDEDASYQALSRAVRWPTCFDAYAKQAAAGNQSGWTGRERAWCNSSQVRQDEFIFKADFAKLRDVTLRAPVPQRLVPGTRTASISLSVQNWYTWKNKDFRLFDPEMAGNDGFNATVRYISEQIPAPATVLARLQIQF